MFLSKLLGAVPQATWLTFYKRRKEAGASTEEAILDVINFLRRRKPFDQITSSEASEAAAVLAELPNPTCFTQVLLQVEQTKDVSHITNIDQLRAFVSFAKLH
jgi:hypothetical protein